jgi:hypothetical protein
LAVTGNLNTGLVIAKPDGQDATAHLEREGTPGRVKVAFKLTKDNVVVEWALVADALEGTKIGPNTAPFKDAKGTATFWDGQFALSIGAVGGQWGSGGPADASTGDVTANFEFKPSVVPGLSAGFSLPGVPAATFTPAEYLCELGLGLKYALENTLDFRFGTKLDSENTTVADGRVGTKVWLGVSPTILGTFVPGLTVWVDGAFGGLGITNGATTKIGFKAAYEQGNLSVTLPLVFEAFAEKSWHQYLPKTEFNIKPEISYKVIPAIKPGVAAELYFHSFDSGDLEAFDRVVVAPYVSLDVGNGLVIQPRFTLTLKGENAKTSWNYDATKSPALQGTGKSATDVKFELRFDYSF